MIFIQYLVHKATGFDAVKGWGDREQERSTSHVDESSGSISSRQGLRLSMRREQQLHFVLWHLHPRRRTWGELPTYCLVLRHFVLQALAASNMKDSPLFDSADVLNRVGLGRGDPQMQRGRSWEPRTGQAGAFR